MTSVSINQPGYLPWMGFFKRIISSDIFVFLDDVQYIKKDWQNRNKIRISQGWQWLTVPVAKNKDKLNEIQIDYSENWNLVHKKSIKYNYSKSRFFEDYWSFFDKLYGKKHTKLIDLNMEIIHFIVEVLNIKTELVYASQLSIEGKKSDLNLEICQKLGADTYLSGSLGTNYLKVHDFEKSNINVKFADYIHPTYKQNFEPFIPNMATIDLLFNEGKKSKQIMDEFEIIEKSNY